MTYSQKHDAFCYAADRVSEDGWQRYVVHRQATVRDRRGRSWNEFRWGFLTTDPEWAELVMLFALGAQQ